MIRETHKLVGKFMRLLNRLRDQIDLIPMYIISCLPANGYRRGLALVHGNCQAIPIAKLLDSSPNFRARYRIVLVPPVHLVKPWQVKFLQRLVSGTSLFITQEIRNGYRDLPIGSRELAEKLPIDATVVKIPVLYYEGNYPFQVYIRSEHGAHGAPITEYADLRAIAAAALGFNKINASDWFKLYMPPADAIREIAANSLSLLKKREETLTIKNISEYISVNSNRILFHTVNHPKNELLIHQAQSILNFLGTPSTLSYRSVKEFLGELKTPKDAMIISTLGLEGESSEKWEFRGEYYDELNILEQQLEWLRTDASALSAALRQHSDRLVMFFPEYSSKFRHGSP